MSRSTNLFFAAAATSVPAWFVNVNELTQSVQIAWLVVTLSLGLAGGYFWATDNNKRESN